MRLLIAAVGRLRAGPDAELYAHYAERVNQSARVVGLGPLSMFDLRESRAQTANERRAEEAAALIARIPSSTVWMLDERGESLSSAGFASAIGALRDGGADGLALALGGPDGHGEAMRGRAARVVSLGAMTLPHGLARIVLAEQLYRAVTILSGHPYHRA
jgi:23S rRNA (pseudouridine1915-N3)-methyltransferase